MSNPTVSLSRLVSPSRLSCSQSPSTSLSEFPSPSQSLRFQASIRILWWVLFLILQGKGDEDDAELAFIFILISGLLKFFFN